MTTYSTGFDSYTTDAQPSDWTARWTTSNVTYAVRSKTGAEGGKVLEHTSTSGARRLLSWDTIDGDANRANVEILARFRFSITATDVIRLVARASGTTGSETSYHLIVNATAANIYLHKYVAGVSANIGSSASFSPPGVNSWLYARFRVNGTTLQGKIWSEGIAEPADWMVVETDSSISAAGWVGLSIFPTTGTRDVDLVSIGTNGDAAPLSISTATVINTHQAVVEGVHATVAKAQTHQMVLEGALSPLAKAQTHQAVLEVAFGEIPPVYLHQAVLEVVVANVAAETQQPRMIVVC